MAAGKTSVFGEDGRITPLTLEAMERKGALAHELEPVEIPEEDSRVAKVRYAFLEERRAGMKRQEGEIKEPSAGGRSRCSCEPDRRN